jgi:hypothetical protein
MLQVRLEIVQHPLRALEVRVVGPNGWVIKTLKCPDIENARVCAEAQANANDKPDRRQNGGDEVVT